MPVVLITPEAMLHKPAPYVDALKAAGFEVVYPRDSTFTRGLVSEDETIAQLSVCDAVLAGGERFTKKVLENLPRLRVIARAGVGYDRVDMATATARGIPVTITPNSNFDAVAEHTLALLFATAKSVIAMDRGVRANTWRRILTAPVRESTLGLIGLGRIGRAVAIRARALGMHVIASESLPDFAFVKQHDLELVSLEQLLSRSDYVSIHCPLSAETKGIINQKTLAQMKPGSVLINTARGPLVNEADLIAALQSGHLRAAGLDVFEQEPPARDNPLFQMENVVLSPHIGGEDSLSSKNMGCEAADCIVRLYRGDWPGGAVVNQELKAGWKW